MLTLNVPALYVPIPAVTGQLTGKEINCHKVKWTEERKINAKF